MRKEYTPEMNIVINAYNNNEKVDAYILIRALADASRIFAFQNINNNWCAMLHDSNAHWDNIVYKQMRAIAEAAM